MSAHQVEAHHLMKWLAQFLVHLLLFHSHATPGEKLHVRLSILKTVT